MSYSIAIPSYKRANKINRGTYKMLLENKLQDKKIYVFLNTAKDVEEYKAAHKSDLKVEYVIHGKTGLKDTRNYMTKYFSSGSRVMYLDDDLTGINKGEPSGMTSKRVYNLGELANKGFQLCKSKGFGKWGLNPSNNQRSLKNTEITFDLRYVKSLYGEIVNHKVINTVTYAEDFERTIQYYIIYGGIVRFNNYTAKTSDYAKGGLEEAGRDKQKEKSDKEAIAKKYPKYATTFIRTEGSGRTDIKLFKNPMKS